MSLQDLTAQTPQGTPWFGLDLGERTIGVAASDATRMIASPLEVIRKTKFGKPTVPGFAHWHRAWLTPTCRCNCAMQHRRAFRIRPVLPSSSKLVSSPAPRTLRRACWLFCIAQILAANPLLTCAVESARPVPPCFREAR